MSTITPNNSSVAPASVVSHIAGIPSGITAPAPRTTGIAGVGKRRVVGHNGTATPYFLGLLPPAPSKTPSKYAASSSALPESSTLQNSGSPQGVPKALNRITGFGNGQRAAQDAGHSVDHFRGTLNPSAPFSRSTISSQPFSFPRASRISNKCLQDGAAKKAELVKYEKSRIKKADSALPKKNRKVTFGKDRVKRFDVEPGDKFPGPAQLLEGEANWRVLKKQIHKNETQARSKAGLKKFENEVTSVLDELAEEEAERAVKLAIEDAKRSEYIVVLLLTASDTYHSLCSGEEQELADRELALERGFIRSTCFSRVCQNVWALS
jgi:hypothetical protein